MSSASAIFSVNVMHAPPPPPPSFPFSGGAATSTYALAAPHQSDYFRVPPVTPMELGILGFLMLFCLLAAVIALRGRGRRGAAPVSEELQCRIAGLQTVLAAAEETHARVGDMLHARMEEDGQTLERFRDLYCGVPVPHVRVLPDLSVVQCNEAFARLFGSSSPERVVMRHSSFEQLFPDLADAEEVLSSGSAAEVRHDGGIYRMISHAVYSDEDVWLRTDVCLVDVTDVRSVLSALVDRLGADRPEDVLMSRTDREELDWYRTAFSQFRIGRFRSEILTGRYIMANDYAARLLGYADAEAVVGASALTHYVDSRDRDRLMQQARENKGQPYVFRTRLRSLAGNLVDVDILETVDFERGYFDGVVLDRTEEADRAREAECQYRLYTGTVDVLDSALFVLSRTGRVTLTNARARELYGLLEGSLEDACRFVAEVYLGDLISRAWGEGCPVCVDRTYAGPPFSFSDDDSRVFRIKVAPIKEGNRVTDLVVILRDVTELVELSAEPASSVHTALVAVRQSHTRISALYSQLIYVERRLRAMLDTMCDVGLVLDRTGACLEIFCGDRVTTRLRDLFQSARGRKLDHTLDDHRVSDFQQAVLRLGYPGDPVTLELDGVTPQGTAYRLALTGTRVSDDQTYYVTARDVTDQGIYQDILDVALRLTEQLATELPTPCDDGACLQGLQALVDHLGVTLTVDRAYLFLNSELAGDCMELYCTDAVEWCATGVSSEKYSPELRRLPYSVMGRTLAETLARGETLAVEDADAEDLPRAARDILRPRGIRALLLVPVAMDDRFYGFVGFDSSRPRRWLDAETSSLRLAASVAALLLHQRTQVAGRWTLSNYLLGGSSSRGGPSCCGGGASGPCCGS